MLISDLLAVPRLGLRVLAGEADTDRPILSVYTTDLPRPDRFLGGGELVLTGMVWHGGPDTSETFVRTLAEAEVGALGAGTAIGEVPEDLVAACKRHGLVLVEVPAEVSFAAVAEEAQRLLRPGQRGGPGAQRRMMTELAAGADFTEVFAAAAREAGIAAWVVSSTGRLVAAADAPLADGQATRLAALFLRGGGAASRTELPLEALPPEQAGAGGPGRMITLLPVRTRHTHPLAGWFLACAGDQRHWPEETADIVAELASGAVLERSRMEERAAADARHVEALPRLLAAQRFEDAAGVLAAIGVEVRGGTAGDTAGSGGYVAVCAALWPEPQSADLPSQLLGELLAGQPSAIVGTATGAAAVAAAAGADAQAAASRLAEELSRRARVLEAGLGGYRLAVGASRAAAGVPALRGALVEARHALRLAQLRAGRVRVVAGAEADSHELLLAAVPREVRSSYADRLLGPLLAYDRDHRSDLVETLRRFLEHSGSWRRCAQAMHVHVNTLRYRIGRIEELTGRDLSTLEHRVDLFLALRLRED